MARLVGVDLAASSVKVIPASQLGWRDGCNGYDDGALVFRLIQAEQSHGVSRSVIREAAVIGLGGVYKTWEACVICRGSWEWVAYVAVRPGDGIHLRHSATGNQLPESLFFPSSQLVFFPLGEITGKQKDYSNDHCGNRGDNLGTEFTH